MKRYLFGAIEGDLGEEEKYACRNSKTSFATGDRKGKGGLECARRNWHSLGHLSPASSRARAWRRQEVSVSAHLMSVAARRIVVLCATSPQMATLERTIWREGRGTNRWARAWVGLLIGAAGGSRARAGGREGRQMTPPRCYVTSPSLIDSWREKVPEQCARARARSLARPPEQNRTISQLRERDGRS